jgi:hypothetical protein
MGGSWLGTSVLGVHPWPEVISQGLLDRFSKDRAPVILALAEPPVVEVSADVEGGSAQPPFGLWLASRVPGGLPRLRLSDDHRRAAMLDLRSPWADPRKRRC